MNGVNLSARLRFTLSKPLSVFFGSYEKYHLKIDVNLNEIAHCGKICNFCG